MNAPIILFRFHTAFDVCRQRLQQLRKYNPDIPIYGLFGGSKQDLAAARRELASRLEHVYLIRHEDVSWKWLHLDISLKEWYRDVGHDLTFDDLYDYEYDLATFGPLPIVYPPAQPNTLFFSNVTLLTPERRRSWQWTGLEPYKSQFEAYSRYMRRAFGLKVLDVGILGPGPLLTRSFVDAFARTDDIDLVLCEISYPAYATALGYRVADNGFYPGEMGGADEKYFNASGHRIEQTNIAEELRKPWGRRVFHPVKHVLPFI